MAIVFQLLLLGLVLYSLLLVVVVPVLYSSASDATKGNRVILIGSVIWFGWVVAVALLNFVK